MLKQGFSIFFLLFTLCTAFAQEEISAQWQSVVGGTVVATPKKTSYGFVMISEGRIMNASTENGTIIWRKNIRGRPSPFFSITEENFVYITTDNAKKLSLYNPDGIFLWEVDLEESATADPLPGRDGRVFVLENDTLSAYGAQGGRKWRIEIGEGAGFPLVEMNDGSLLYVLGENGIPTSAAIRISPYGQIIEKIEFIDTITTIQDYEDGVILGFENGSIGSCAVIDGVTKTISSAFTVESDAYPKSIVIGDDSFFVLFSDASISEFSMENNSVIWRKDLLSTLDNSSVYLSYINGSLVVANTEYVCAYYSAESNRGGSIAWEKRIASSSGAYFPFITGSAYLVLSHPNWVVAGYNLLDSELISENVMTEGKKVTVSYSTFKENSKHTRQSIEAIYEHLQNDDYGALEVQYQKRINSEITTYNQEYQSFITNTNIAEKSLVYLSTALFESSDYNYIIPLMLNGEIDPYFIQLALQVAATIAYDPREIMLAAIEEYYSLHKSLLSDAVQMSVCDAVYSICKYMGRPALTKRGKQILSDMIQTSESMHVQKKVGETLFKFIELEQ